MNNRGRVVLTTCLLGIAASVSSCAGVQTTSYTYNNSYQLNRPVKTDGCYDASVLLGKGANDTKDIIRKSLAAVDAKISEETNDGFNAQRNRHIGVLVGSGGEELTVRIKAVSDDQTFVTVTTKTGFVGGAGQKAWSCEIVDQLVTLATQ